MTSIRYQRKKDHINYSLLLEKSNRYNFFNDITLIPNCLPEVNFDEIDFSTNLKNIKLKNPIIINAMTGGIEEAIEINRHLAKIAKIHDLAIAVGSQRISLEGKGVESFTIVREVYPDGIIFSNIGANTTPKEALKIVDMIEADALQIHLNAPQELAMKEGQKNFKGTIENIKEIVDTLKIPVIVKEVGFGIAKEEAKKLQDIGVKIIDVGGYGGTNFISIENQRYNDPPLKNFANWGIPTPITLIEVLSQVSEQIDIIASGGIRNGLDATKALALGAKAVAFAGGFLYILVRHGPDALVKHIQQIKNEILFAMALCGAENLSLLQKRSLIIEGKTRNWLESRDISWPR